MTVARDRQRDVLGSAARRDVPIAVEPRIDPLADVDVREHLLALAQAAPA